MATYFVSQHPGAQRWGEQQGIQVDQVIGHLDASVVEPGDFIIGSLPVNLAAELCRREGRYLHLSLRLPADLRGVELSAGQMRPCGARIEEYRVQRVEVGAGQGAEGIKRPGPRPRCRRCCRRFHVP